MIMEVRPALLFIPDISGFTKFVGENEIQHSRHIIEELQEVLIDVLMRALTTPMSLFQN